MNQFSFLFLCLFFLISNIGITQNIKDLQDINLQVWQNFTISFETLDYQLFSNIHSDDLIRVSGDSKSIRTKNDYIDGYKKRWKKGDIDQTISFRFLERISDGEKASERGIYKLTRNPDTLDERSYYGKFHVILKKENNTWKILVDYDSTENNLIDETSFKNAFSLADYEKY